MFLCIFWSKQSKLFFLKREKKYQRNSSVLNVARKRLGCKDST